MAFDLLSRPELSTSACGPCLLAFLPSALSLNHLFIKLNLTVAAAAVAAAILTAAAAGAAIAIAFG